MNRIKLGFVCGVLLSTLIAAGCGMPLTEYTEEIKGGPAEENPSSPVGPSVPGGPSEGNGVSLIAVYDLQAYVPVPTAGAIPVEAIEGRQDLGGSVEWKDQDGNSITGSPATFALGVVYQAVITLTAKEGYSFVPAASFKYYPAGVVESQSNPDTAASDAGRMRERSVTVTYKGTADPITLGMTIDLTNLVPSPVPGLTPVTSFSPGQYSGTVEWSPKDDVFQGGTTYTASVTLTPAPGYVFPESVPVIHNGDHPAPGNFTGEPRTGTIVFPAGSEESSDIWVGWV
jgi:hypothetical protein